MAIPANDSHKRWALSFDPTFFTKDPLFWPIADAARTFAAHRSWPTVADVDEHFASASGVRFVLQPPKPRRKRGANQGEKVSYDEAITKAGVVPTRANNWHDLLNAFVWATFPNAKRAVHAKQHEAIQKRLETGALGSRSRSEDALALLDEGGVFVMCLPSDFAAIKADFAARDEQKVAAAFKEGRARSAVFGHAIFEGLVLGRPDGWGAALFVSTDELANVDAATRGSEGSSPPLGATFDWDVGDENAFPKAVLLRSLDGWLAQELSKDASFQSPEVLSRADLPLIRSR